MKLNKTIDCNSADMDEDDVLAVKSSLKDLNYYNEPKYGMTKIPDNEMFDGIKKFQTDNKLKVDGIMKPKGETENKVNEKIKSSLHSYTFSGNNATQYNNIVQRVLDTKNSVEKTARILAPQQINDKYKHAYLSCKEAQKGNIEAATIAVGGLYKEYLDQKTKKEHYL